MAEAQGAPYGPPNPPLSEIPIVDWRGGPFSLLKEGPRPPGEVGYGEDVANSLASEQE
jgi:hypothetical protein